MEPAPLTPSIHPARFAVVRASIFAQHDELQRLTRASAALAGAAMRGDQPCQQELPRMLDTLLGKLQEHLEFEQSALLAPLRAEPKEREYADRIAAEHVRQRAELSRLTGECWSGDLARLVAGLERFLLALGADIAEEERWLLRRPD
jgi:hypothetical protein